MKLSLGQRHKNARALIKMLHSQCVHVSALGDKRIGFSIEIDSWLEENAGDQLPNIPFVEAEQGYLRDIKNKWAIHYERNMLVYWIQNTQARTEFALRWGDIHDFNR
jgi:hypothetical protein